jgi:hypothetical protein
MLPNYMGTVTEVMMFEYGGISARVLSIGKERIRCRISPGAAGFVYRDPVDGEAVYFNGTLVREGARSPLPRWPVSVVGAALKKRGWMLVDPISVTSVKKWKGLGTKKAKHAIVREVAIPWTEEEQDGLS